MRSLTLTMIETEQLPSYYGRRLYLFGHIAITTLLVAISLFLLGDAVVKLGDVTGLDFSSVRPITNLLSSILAVASPIAFAIFGIYYTIAETDFSPFKPYARFWARRDSHIRKSHKILGYQFVGFLIVLVGYVLFQYFLPYISVLEQ